MERGSDARTVTAKDQNVPSRMLEPMHDALHDDLVTDEPQEAGLGVLERMRLSRRESDDDFFCLRYEVWYPSFDCAMRTKFRTSPGCQQCQQGRFNLKRHSQALRQVRFPLLEP